LAVRCSRFAVRGSRFAVRGSRFAVRGSRFAVRGSRFAVRGLNPRQPSSRCSHVQKIDQEKLLLFSCFF
jgi:hypothetical protein